MDTFKDSLAADLPAFFNTDEFAITADFNGTPINGLFDPGSQGEREERSPGFTCRNDEIRPIPYGSLVTIEDQTYWVEAYRPDSHGLALVILRRD